MPAGGEKYRVEPEGTDPAFKIVPSSSKKFGVDTLDVEVRKVLLLEDAEEGNLASVLDLLRISTPLQCVDRERRNPFHKAALEGHVEVVKALLAAATTEADKALVHARDKWGNTPLFCACTKPQPSSGEVCRILVAQGGAKVHVVKVRAQANARRQRRCRCFGPCAFCQRRKKDSAAAALLLPVLAFDSVPTPNAPAVSPLLLALRQKATATPLLTPTLRSLLLQRATTAASRRCTGRPTTATWTWSSSF